MTSHHRHAITLPARAPLRPPLRVWVLLAVLVTVSALAAAPLAARRSFAWKVTGKSTSIYLVGSVHLLSKDYYPLSPALDAAYADSDLLVEEVDLGEMLEPSSQMRILSRGMLPAGQTLEKVVSKETFAAASRKASSLGLPVAPLQQFKPWSLSLMLMSLVWTNAGFDPDLGLDKHFYDRAVADHRLVQGLETTEFQISRFDEMTMPEQDRLLAQTIRDLDSGLETVTDLADAWKAGDADLVERLALGDMKDEPALYQRLLVERNRTWLPKLEALFNRRGRALVVVGAAHMVGPDGLIQALKVKGYTVEQL